MPSGRSKPRRTSDTSRWRLRELKRRLDQPANVVQLDFLETHPYIRPLEAYRIALVENIPRAIRMFQLQRTTQHRVGVLCC